MFIVAGAPGSGKSTLLHLSSFDVDWFNADDEAAKRNSGIYEGINRFATWSTLTSETS
jgi:predicted ABC-type ATPase